MLALGHAITLGVPSPHAPAALAGQELGTAAQTARASSWTLDPRVYEEPGQFTGCPDDHRNAAESECLAAVQEATTELGLVLEGHVVKVVDAGADGLVPSGCSYSRGHGLRAIFNRNPAGRNWRSYPLVCLPTTPSSPPRMRRLAIFTVSTGGYDVDDVVDEPPPQDGIDFFLFCTKGSCPTLADTSIWHLREIQSAELLESFPAVLKECEAHMRPLGMPSLPSSQCLSRVPKIMSHIYLSEYTHSMYVDANVRLSGQHLQGLFDHLDQNGADYATFTLPRPIRQEADWVVNYLAQTCKLDEDAKQRMVPLFDALVANYSTNGDADWGSTMYGKVLVRRHNEKTTLFNELWWREFTSGAPRDQLSMRWCVREAERRLGLEYLRLGEGDTPQVKKDPMWREYFVHEGVKDQRTTPGSSVSSSDASCTLTDATRAYLTPDLHEQ